MIPVPGRTVGTQYGVRGPHWSCRRDASGNGIHTGVDYPAPSGTTVVAARPGRAYFVSHGSAFGSHQIEVRCSDGTRDFYAHMLTRLVANGSAVAAGQQIGRVGSEGNATGPHLHFERHATSTGGWSCDVVRDPALSIAYQQSSKSAARPEKLKRTNVEKARARIKRAIADLEKAPESRTRVQKARRDLAAVLDELPSK
jgi:murein DD-endopeptidase MepM/ murein hydrolase activator NlpD